MAAALSPVAAALLRWVAFCGGAVLLGAVAIRIVTAGDPGETAKARIARLVHVSAAAILISAAGRMAQQALALASEPAAAWDMVRTLLGTTWGYAWIVQQAAAVVLAAAPNVVSRPRRGGRWTVLSGALVAAVAIAPAFQGHAIGAPELAVQAVVSDIAHLVAAGMWMGTLFVLVVAVLPEADASQAAGLVQRFSPLALTGAATLGATGVFATWLHVRQLPLVWGSAYGQVLCVKLAIIAGVVGLGAVNWKRRSAQLAGAEGVPRLLSTARAELALGTVALLATAFLVATPLPGE